MIYALSNVCAYIDKIDKQAGEFFFGKVLFSYHVCSCCGGGIISVISGGKSFYPFSEQIYVKYNFQTFF